MAKYNVGDKVRLVADLHQGDDYAIYCNEEMERYAGEVVTILSVSVTRRGAEYTISRGTDWRYTEDMIEGKAETEEEEEELPTLMVKGVEWKPDWDAYNVLADEAVPFLRSFRYGATTNGVKEIIKVWSNQKQWLIDLFSKHEFYNGNYMIVIPAKLKRPLDMDGIKTFKRWVKDEYAKSLREKRIMVGLHDLYDYKQCMANIRYNCSCLNPMMTLNGFTRKYYEDELRRMQKRIDQITDACLMDTVDKPFYVSETEYDKNIYFGYVIDGVLDVKETHYRDSDTPHMFNDKLAKYVNTFLENGGFKTRAVNGLKISKFMGKLLKEVGLNHVVDIKTETWTDPATGEVRERKKDMGYNYHYALLGDSINPYEYERDIVLSINPFDYWTMSFGFKWASCHTIDKDNSRHMDSSHNYSGCYSGGTESYMLDNSSIIVYVRPTKEELEKIGEESLPIEQQSKMKRCVFMLGEDKLVQSRVYPDGRDGGDEGLAAQLREIVQRTIAELLDTPNMWVNKKGSSECEDVIYENDGYTHYRDYAEYNDCNVSYLKRINGSLNYKYIQVGSDIICPNCGKWHCCEQHITCETCYDEDNDIIYCERCNSEMREDEGIETEDGSRYCCSSCARNDGYVLTADTDVWISRDNAYYDGWTEEYYEYDDDGVYIGDCWYHDSDTAERAGYIYDEEIDEWKEA